MRASSRIGTPRSCAGWLGIAAVLALAACSGSSGGGGDAGGGGVVGEDAGVPARPAADCGGGGSGRCLVLEPGTNDRESILSVLIDAQEGDVIVLKAGTYHVDGQLSLDVPGVTIRGEGMDRTILSFASQTAAGESLLVRGDRFTLQDLAVLDGPGDQIKVFDATDVTIRRVRVAWSAGPRTENGAYGLYPIQCTNVLIEDSEVSGASDAGIYVGQSKNVVVRRNRAFENVAGIEIENSQDADVYGNDVTDNTAGILVFNLPGLPFKNGRRTRVFANRVAHNDTPNFALPGNIVGGVPTGTGVMVMANDDTEVFDNDILDNGTFGVAVISYRTAQIIGGYASPDARFDPYSEGVHVHDNRFAGNGGNADPATGKTVRELLGLASDAPLPTIVVDGDVNPAKLQGGVLPAALRTCVAEPGQSFASLDALHGFAAPTTDPGAYDCTLPAVTAAAYEGTTPGALPSGLERTIAPAGGNADEETRCTPSPDGRPHFDPNGLACDLLSSYALFRGDGAAQRPNDGVVPYDLNTPLFSDGADKHRFAYVPAGEKAVYRPFTAFDFPVGTVLVKSFGYVLDERDPSRGEKLIETRLLLHRADRWVAVTYRWNDAQTDAVLHTTGDDVPVEWIDADGNPRSLVFHVPDVNQCKECHEEVIPFVSPLGPKARNLNKTYAYDDGEENQLLRWTRLGILDGAPSPDAAPRAAVLSDPSSGTLEERARTYLDVNCAGCHGFGGLARTSGLRLSIDETDPTALGICKSPVAAGNGAGAFRYDIDPGHPETSILIYRMQSTEPGVAMPELGRQLPHGEAIELLSEWIRSMPGQCTD